MTKKGDILAKDLAPDYLPDERMRNICALICRHTQTYHNLMVELCNGDRVKHFPNWDAWKDWLDEEEERLEFLIAHHTKQLDPEINIRFQGDPRGYVVKLQVPSGRYNDWGQEGIGVPVTS